MKTHPFSLFAASITTVLALSSAAFADTTWNGSSSGSWATLDNWTTTIPTSTDLVIYGAGTGVGVAIPNAMQTLDGSYSVKGFSLGNSDLVTIDPGSGGTLTIGASGILLNAGSGVGLLIGTDVALGSAQSWVTGGLTNTRPITVNGAVDLGTFLLTVNALNTNVVTIGGVASGTGSITKSGVGTLTLTGANNYEGTTRVNQGTVSVTGSGVLGGKTGSTADANNIVFGAANNSGTLAFETSANLGAADQIRFRNTGGTAGSGGKLNFIGTTAQTVGKTIQCDTSIGIRLGSDSVGGSITYDGAFSNNTARPLFLEGTGDGDNTLVTPFAGLSITKRGAGKWVLSGLNTYTGDTTVSGGVLAVNGTSIADTNKLVIDGGKVDLTNTETVNTLFFGSVQQPAGNYTMAGDATHFSGGGTLHVNIGPGYSTWAAANAPGQTKDQDHDNDGVDNGVEYFMGESGNGFTASPALSSGTVTWTKGGSYTGTYGTDFLVETSTDLVIWVLVPVGTDPLLGTVTNDSGAVTYTPPVGQTKRFGRLVVNN